MSDLRIYIKGMMPQRGFWKRFKTWFKPKTEIFSFCVDVIKVGDETFTEIELTKGAHYVQSALNQKDLFKEAEE